MFSRIDAKTNSSIRGSSSLRFRLLLFCGSDFPRILRHSGIFFLFFLFFLSFLFFLFFLKSSCLSSPDKRSLVESIMTLPTATATAVLLQVNRAYVGFYLCFKSLEFSQFPFFSCQWYYYVTSLSSLSCPFFRISPVSSVLLY